MIREAQKRIAIFLPALHGGGAERTMLSLAGGFASKGHDVDLVLARAVGPYMDEVPESVRLVNLKSRGTLACLPALTGYLKRERPDGMVSALSRANVVAIGARWLTGIPSRLVVNEQNTLSQWSGKNTAVWRERVMPRLARACYRRATRVAAVSQGVADDLMSVCKIPPDNVQVIHNPGAAPEISEKANQPFDHPWFRAGQPPVMVAVGSLTEQKDFSNLLHAFALLRRQYSARLVILGDGPERPHLESLSRNLQIDNDVGLLGFVSNPYPFMAHAAAFVLSSKFEGLPTVLIEAMVCEAPLIATDCPSGPREILRQGQFGLLVPIGQPEALADAMKKALDGHLPKPPRYSWQPYTLDTIVDQYLSVLFRDPLMNDEYPMTKLDNIVGPK